MVQESTMICVDNSDWMRNGDMPPNRLQCQQEATRMLIQFKLRSNPENVVGLMSMAEDVNVLTSLTTEERKLMARLHQVDFNGSAKVMRAIKTAHLVLKNRSNRNHKMRIVIFIGSPLDDLESEYGDGEFLKLSKKLKKENVKVDFILFGEATSIKNQVILNFVDTINGTEGTGSNCLVVPGNAKLLDALLSSPICRDENGAGAAGEFAFGIDAEDDPELALALRVSMEEQRQRQRQEDEAANGAGVQAGPEPMDVDSNKATPAGGSSSAGGSGSQRIDNLDPAAMTEEEQLQWALRMSMIAEEQEITKSAETTSSRVTTSGDASGGSATGTNLLQPAGIYASGTAGSTEARATGGVNEGNKVDDEVLSSAGATASGTPAPTPMEADDDETGRGEDRVQHANALGQLMDNPDLLQQLVNQIPEPDSTGSSEKKKSEKK